MRQTNYRNHCTCWCLKSLYDGLENVSSAKFPCGARENRMQCLHTQNSASFHVVQEKTQAMYAVCTCTIVLSFHAVQEKNSHVGLKKCLCMHTNFQCG